MRAMLWIAIGVAASVPLLASCSGSSGSSAGSSPNRGTVTGKVQLSGGPAPGTTRAVQGEVFAFEAADLAGKAVATTTTSADGSFNLDLPPGTYYLAATSPSFTIDPPPTTPPCRSDRPAIVTNGNTVELNVVCAMK